MRGPVVLAGLLLWWPIVGNGQVPADFTWLNYLSEAYGGYHWNTMNGINVDAGIFMS